MTEKKWACIKDGKVEMVVIWDGIQEWSPSENYEMIELETDSFVGVDWDYNNGKFTDNRPSTEVNI
jgi:hypothetical protein